MINSEVGYIRLNKFSSQTYREFMEALEALKKNGLQKLILDLRDNGGGILDEAVEIADEFLDGDKLITYTEGKHVDTVVCDDVVVNVFGDFFTAPVSGDGGRKRV